MPCAVLYSVSSCLACQRFNLGSQVFSDDKKPFHMVRYFCCPGDPLWEMILLTSYSSSDLIMIGGGDKKFGPCVVVSLYGDRRVAWNMSWIFHVSGSQR